MTHYVAVIGGFWNVTDEQLQGAQEFARDLGAELARAGLGIVVYFSDPMSLEPYVVSGYVAATPVSVTEKRIVVRYAESQKGQVRFTEQGGARDGLFDPRLFPGTDWEAPFYRSLADTAGVDGVVLVAGARSTLIAGQIAVARQVPLLAVDKFPGSGEAIWSELARTIPNYPSSTHQPTAVLVKWLVERCEARARARERDRRAEALYRRSVADGRVGTFAGLSLLSLLLSLHLATTGSPPADTYPLVTYFGLVAAGATGALARSLLWSDLRVSASRSLFFGSLAGLVVGLAYLIPQWVGAPGVLSAGAKIAQATDKIQFGSAVLVALAAGIGFDSVFTRLRSRADEVPVAV